MPVVVSSCQSNKQTSKDVPNSLSNKEEKQSNCSPAEISLFICSCQDIARSCRSITELLSLAIDNHNHLTSCDLSLMEFPTGTRSHLIMLFELKSLVFLVPLVDVSRQ